MNNTVVSSSSADQQYSLAKILAIWAVVSLPMPVLAFVVCPALIPYFHVHPGFVYWILMIVGMIWQFVVSMFILKRELGTLSWAAIRQRVWLNLPRDPQTGRENAKLFWWLIPCVLFAFVMGQLLGEYLDAPLTWIFPVLKAPIYTDVTQLADPQFKGQWWILGVTLVSFVFNYFLGEELLFRGILLPKMKGVFGRWDWVANTVLFGLYHLHKAWSIPSIIIDSFATVWPARRFQSNWMAVIVHGLEGVSVIVLVVAVILGLYP
jgi:membrane protease YdiL (CAAX protease family)